jgi:hypothetical protein
MISRYAKGEMGKWADWEVEYRLKNRGNSGQMG